MSPAAVQAPPVSVPTGWEVLAVRPSRSATSHAVFEVRARDDRGTEVDLVLKDLSRDALLREARRPGFVEDPAREVVVYTEVLAGRDWGAPRCWGARSDSATGEHWLLLEKVVGVELFQVGDRAVWATVAAWAAVFHRAMAAGVGAAPSCLLRYDASMCRRFAARAEAFGADDDPDRKKRLRWVLDRHATVVDDLVSMPSTVLHGDFSASNVVVDDGDDGLRVCPIDWETASVGPGLLDLAALTAGWPADDRRAIALAYHRACGDDGADEATFLAGLDRCAVQLCIQWLGWSRRWLAPTAHRKDWLGEAVTLLEGLGP